VKHSFIGVEGVTIDEVTLVSKIEKSKQQIVSNTTDYQDRNQDSCVVEEPLS